MNDLVFNPLLPWPVLVAIALVLVAGCVVLAVRTAGRRTQWVLRAAAVVVLALAFSRPGIPVTAVTERSEAALDVFVVVDVTASMVAEDWDGDAPRLDGVEEDVSELMEQAPEARYSLITFAATSQTVLPLTT
ncbi:MAG: vWA domain-containing protein, partial [Brevibacterium yomogidense]